MTPNLLSGTNSTHFSVSVMLAGALMPTYMSTEALNMRLLTFLLTLLHALTLTNFSLSTNT
jgi:hypothetical protein